MLCISQIAAPATRAIASSSARRFSTGSEPGNPRHTGHVFVLGGSPKRVEHPQKTFVAVASCTWTSSPITGSYFASAALIAPGSGGAIVPMEAGIITFRPRDVCRDKLARRGNLRARQKPILDRSG